MISPPNLRKRSRVIRTVDAPTTTAPTSAPYARCRTSTVAATLAKTIAAETNSSHPGDASSRIRRNGRRAFSVAVSWIAPTAATNTRLLLSKNGKNPAAKRPTQRTIALDR
jgi:hypothetical protein